MGHKKSLKRNLLIALLAGSAALYTMPIYAATSVIANNALPSGGSIIAGEITIPDWAKPDGNQGNNLVMNIQQSTPNGIIKWDKFDVGGSATVNFNGPQGGYNTLNYVNSGAASQIYGTINGQGGNIYVVNPAGVQIGNSAQINVGSLYVSNANLDDTALNNFFTNAKVEEVYKFAGKEGVGFTNAELMSLGNINATNVTFEGDGRIVIDSERIKDGNGDNKLSADNIFINTANENNVIIGYDAYDEENKTYANTSEGNLVTLNKEGNYITKADGYMWVEDVDQLQAINTNLEGNYALRNSIDATSTEQNGFISIGLNGNNEIKNEGKGFTGNFDGIEYNIFGLNITGNNNAGLFGYTDGAIINNVTLVGGSISGGENVGAVVGSANNTTISNVVNSAAVTGGTNVGGIIGSATGTTVENAINTGAVTSNGTSDNNGGLVSNVGGLIGSMTDNDTNDEYKSQLIGNSYNLGNVEGKGYNVGGLVGHAVNSTIGDGTNLVYNRLDVTGLYNVGGIVGNMEGSTVQNAENSATVTATGFDEGTYTYHTANVAGGSETKDVYIANVGGIAGIATKTDTNESKIENVTNTGDVSSNSADFEDDTIYYTAGNVGGIVGSAVDTNITNATNQENDVRGAHNVGGVAGYFCGSGTVTNGINDGGDIMATGARNGNGFVTETVRPVGNSNETFIIGNIGGIVGYMDGDNVYVTGSANRGTVHSYDIDEKHAENVLDISKAANVGGVVGKIDRSRTKDLSDIEDNVTQAAVSNSYNTGDVRGYTGVGGVVGMMYNGEVAGSYNLGYIRTTRIATNSSNIDAVNMGGVVGDTTEGTNANALIYDVYNKGQIGDDTYTYYARHVAGIVGRLSGTVEKAYNNGEIYNGYTATGGIAGWMYKGSINNAFNTGNITVYNHDTSTSQVGGIVGAASVDNGSISLSNIYNLGTIRSFKANQNYSGSGITHSTGNNAVGGIIGAVMGSKYDLFIDGAYTTGNIYAGNQGNNGSISLDTNNNDIGSIYGELRSINDSDVHLTNVYYIRPQSGLDFTTLGTNDYGRDNSNKAIDYANRSDSKSYSYDGNSLTFTYQTGGAVTGTGDWRIYGDTPILNAFLPDSEQYFDQYDSTEKLKGAGMVSVQYGTAYDPLLTIITANEGTDNLTFNFGTGDNELSITNAAGLVVYNAGLTLNNFDTNSGAGYFGGTIYADGVLNLNAEESNNIGFGSASQIYGSSVNIEADGTVTIYGDVTATGNDNDNQDEAGSIKITSTGGDVDIYGTLTSAKSGQSVTIPGIAGTADLNWSPVETDNSINDPSAELNTIGDRFAHTTTASNVNGNIIISAGATDGDGKVTATGNVNLYYGNKENGITTTGGDLTVTATGDVYVDSDLAIGGDLTLKGTGENSEVVLDLTNIGQVQADNGISNGLDNFLTHFENTGDNSINFGETADAKITVDMWENNELNLDKFGSDFTGKLNVLDLNGKTAKDITHIWVSNAEQLKNIQNASKDALGYNFALKNDINASDLTDYVAIGTGNENGFTGTFDGRGNRIIGLTVENNDPDNGNAGIFSTIGETGVVKNLNIYSGNFTGTTNAGAVAGENNGRIENITAFGNTVTSNGNAGGIVGVNSSGEFDQNGNLTDGIYDVESTGSVIAGQGAIAGGLVGTNDGALGNSFSNSAVTSNTGTDAGLGGVVGVNTENGEVQYVDSLGVTNGGDTGSSNIGGVIGINNGTLHSAYNESIVSGSDNVGGIIGENNNDVTNIVNATSVTGIDDGIIEDEDDTAKNGISDYVGGLVGSNSGSVTNGRNNGTITGTNYVGGMVGDNASGAELTDLVNDSSASITGEQYVGGIAGSNSGTISATDTNLINRGSITGNKYVGGIAGVNEETGIIDNTISSIALNVKDPETKDDNDDSNNPSYFGGVVGKNSGTIDGATNTSSVDVAADGATYVGGIIGQNTSTGELQGTIRNDGTVSGLSNVGGIIGENNNAQLLNNDDNNERLQITNAGSVSATKGGAAGIFYNNNITGSQGDTNANAINNADITNSGTVTGGTGEDSVTGGLFGYNSGNITNSTLTNTGTVTGGGTVGGLIGINTGNINYSSLKNLADITVSGNVKDVGGLIGKNTGTITGGRNEDVEMDAEDNVTAEADSYYKYQIYNNGIITVDGSGKNIGGLIGYNEGRGSLTAGYNTGAINAESSTNVGGIAGSNSGTIDQVFNTVMTAGGINETITGGTNVGGLVGNNEGTLTNAYNTTAVKVSGNIESAVVGNAVGTNSGTITNIYATNTTGNLIGENTNVDTDAIQNAYSFSNADIENEIGVEVIDDNNQKNSASYDGFDFDSTGATKDGETAASDGDNDYWKIYAGSGNPLLKVFLTSVKVNADNLPDFVYNTQDQDLNIGNLTGENGAFSAADDFSAYNNNNSLIQNTDFEHKNAGTYDDWLYSQQIAASSTDDSFNPNNLGYDIELSHDIDKAQITVDLNEVERTYGDIKITKGEYGYSYDFANVNNDTDSDNLRNELNNNNALLLGKVDLTKDDGGLVEDGKKTNNAGDYNWTGTVNIADGYQGNYEFVLTTDQSNDKQSSLGTNGTSITTIGGSKVNKRQLSISDIIANIMYGNQDKKGFNITSGGTLVGVNGEDGIVYDDDVKLNTNLDVEDENIVANSVYATNKGDDRTTADVGRYENSLSFTSLGLTGDKANNYELVSDIVGGTINVTQATITVDLNDVNRTYGNTAFNGNSYGVNNVQGIVNNDNYIADDFVVTAGTDGALTGQSSGRVTNDAGEYTYSGTVNSNNDKLNQNYKIVVNNSETNNNVGVGVSTISKADLTVTINDVNTTYGTAFNENDYSYSLDNLVNGDQNNQSSIKEDIDSAAGGYKNTGAADGVDGKVTQAAEGDYSLSFNKNIVGEKDVLKNYNITVVKAGKSHVDKATITIDANNEEIHLGETPNYTGTDINDALVNGDSLNGNYHYGVEDGTVESVVGTHTGEIGVWIGNTFYDLSQNVDWTKVANFFSNYEVKYTPGTLTVTDQVLPDLPDNWPSNRWDYLFSDNPFDRNRNFRERKAEVNFVGGGMEI